MVTDTLFNARAYTDSLYKNAHLQPDADTDMVTRRASLPLKTVGEGRVGGYLVVWGSPAQKDLHGEYFTPETDFALDWYPQRPALYHHGLDGTMQIAAIGTIDSIKADNVGLWAEMQLDLRKKYIRDVMELVNQGALNWSSGSLGHLIEVGSDGWIKRWPIVEGSATPSPAEPRKTNIVPLKLHAFKAALTAPPDDLSEAATGNRTDAGTKDAAGAGESVTQPQTTHERKVLMDEQLLLQVIMATAEMLGATITEEQAREIMASVSQPATEAVAAVPAGAAPQEFGKALAAHAPFTQALKSAITLTAANADPAGVAAGFKTALTGMKGTSKAPVFHTETPAPVVTSAADGHSVNVNTGGFNLKTYTKYHGLSAEDMSYMAMVLGAEQRRAGRPFAPLSEDFLKELAGKAVKQASGAAGENQRIHLYDEHADAIKAIVSGGYAYGGEYRFRRAAKSDELDYSTQAGYGDEWVPDLWSANLWERARLENRVLGLFDIIDMPSNPFELPVESTDPTVYYVPETTNQTQQVYTSGNPIPQSKFGTAKAQLSAKKFALRVGLSAELEEDSIIPVASRARQQAERSIMNSIDFVLLNGDTETGATGNINSDDGAPTATDRYLAFNGILKSALVTNTTKRLDASGAAPTLGLLRQTRFKMDIHHAYMPDELALIVGGDGYASLLNLNEFLTMDKFGPNATILKGQIGNIDGSPVIVSAELAQAEADGKVNTASPSGTLFGRMAWVNRRVWIVGYRRRVNVTMEFMSGYDAYQLTATVRMGLVQQNANASSVLYDLAT